jgi:hypothetical protein
MILAPIRRMGVDHLEAHQACRGTLVRVREGHWKTEFAGMLGTVEDCWGQSAYAAVDVRLEDGRSELFWLSSLDVVDEEVIGA